MIIPNGVKIRTNTKHLHIHCSASGLNQAPAILAFTDDRIMLQEIQFGRPCFSGSILGFVEATRHDQV